VINATWNAPVQIIVAPSCEIEKNAAGATFCQDHFAYLVRYCPVLPKVGPVLGFCRPGAQIQKKKGARLNVWLGYPKVGL
jgi:hypothetical protein